LEAKLTSVISQFHAPTALLNAYWNEPPDVVAKKQIPVHTGNRTLII